MPNVAIIPGTETHIAPLRAVIDGYPEATHKLETSTGGEPLEDGRAVTDHAVARQARLTLVGWVSDFSGKQAADAWNAIIRLHRDALPVEIVTEWGTYREMILRRVEAPQVDRGMAATMEFEEIIRVGIIDGDLVPAQVADGPGEGRSGLSERGRIALAT